MRPTSANEATHPEHTPRRERLIWQIRRDQKRIAEIEARLAAGGGRNGKKIPDGAALENGPSPSGECRAPRHAPSALESTPLELRLPPVLLGMEFFAEVPDADAILSRTGCREKAFERFVLRFAA